MGRREQLVAADNAQDTPQQHQKPCPDCPWARKALAGWTGDMTAQEWVLAAHGESHIECHTLKACGSVDHFWQCAGAAIYRANVAKQCRGAGILQLPRDTKLVFATPMEFKKHHGE